MCRLYRFLAAISIIILLLTACNMQPIPDETVSPQAVTYKQVLGKTLSDNEVLVFIANHNCSSAAQFWLCKEIGVSLLIDTNEVVETVYLYLKNTEGFSPYEGELPLGLKFYDTLGAVEYKLNRQGVGIAGKPDEGSAADRFHYRAVYKQVGVTILYNAPYPDEDATIYAILVSSKYLSISREENGLQ